MSDAIAPECKHCLDRIIRLERIALDHESRRAQHDAFLSTLDDKIDKVCAGNSRIERILERVLDLITPSAEGHRQP